MNWPRALQESRESRAPSSALDRYRCRDNAQSVHLFRIAQEALSNALQHGHAKAVVIALEAGDGACSLRVSDDGVGFVPSRSERNGMGLSIMRYRARIIYGT